MTEPINSDSLTAEEQAILAQLPVTLAADTIRELNAPNTLSQTQRHYSYEGHSYLIPPGVFLPGETSKLIHNRIVNGDIPVRGKDVCVVGCGAGIEGVLLHAAGARTICLADLDPVSVQAARENFALCVPGASISPIFLTSDLFSNFSHATKWDVILFNPPAVSVPVSDDTNVIRNTSVGTSIVLSFAEQILSKSLLKENGSAFCILSNTAELRRIYVELVCRGFSVSIFHSQGWPPPYEHLFSFVFKLTRNET